jgi:hypothetical protein
MSYIARVSLQFIEPKAVLEKVNEGVLRHILCKGQGVWIAVPASRQLQRRAAVSYRALLVGWHGEVVVRRQPYLLPGGISTRGSSAHWTIETQPSWRIVATGRR